MRRIQRSDLTVILCFQIPISKSNLKTLSRKTLKARQHKPEDGRPQAESLEFKL
jgi:hypothetical protein